MKLAVHESVKVYCNTDGLWYTGEVMEADSHGATVHFEDNEGR